MRTDQAMLLLLGLSDAPKLEYMKAPTPNTKPGAKAYVSKLVVGGRYLHRSGYCIRRILAIDGKDVLWADHIGSGRCTKTTFIKICTNEAIEK